jgi:hypothetical protein
VVNWSKGDTRVLGVMGVDALDQVWTRLVLSFEASSAEALKWTGLVLALKRAVRKVQLNKQTTSRAAKRWLVGWHPYCAL